TGPEWSLSVAQRMLIAGRAIWFYVGKIFVPVKLTFIYPRWDVSASDPLQWVYPIGVVAALGVLIALRNRIGRGPAAAWMSFCGVLVPALGFVNIYPMRYSFVAEH